MPRPAGAARKLAVVEPRLAAISGKSRVFCVLGHPIAHTMSPAMHNAALPAMGIDGVYVAFDVAPEQIGTAIEGLQALGVGGVNLTIPLKEAVLPYLDELSPEAGFIGAVNTVQFTKGRRIGHNTDARGFIASLRAGGAEPEGARVAILGAGGSARAVAVALAQVGAELVLLNRTAERAAALADRLNTHVRPCARTASLETADLHRELARADILVNTTSVGMSPHADVAPLIPAEALHAGLFVCDLIYNPLETRLLAAARERGARTLNGVGMLAHQGALALEIWTGQTAPVSLMEATIRETLIARRQGNDSGGQQESAPKNA